KCRRGQGSRLDGDTPDISAPAGELANTEPNTAESRQERRESTEQASDLPKCVRPHYSPTFGSIRTLLTSRRLATARAADPRKMPVARPWVIRTELIPLPTTSVISYQRYDKESTANDTNSIRRRDWLGGSTRPISPIAAARRPAAVAIDAHTRTRSEPAMSVIDFASARPVMVIAPMKAPVRYVKTAAGWPGLVSRTVPSGIMSPLSRYVDGGA